MKGLKKFLTGILAGAMAMSITFTAGTAMTAKAADITINSAANSDANKKEASTAQTYTWYKILSADASAGASLNSETNEVASGTVVYYTDTEDRAKALKSTGYFDYTLASDGRYNVYATYEDANKPSGEELAAAFDQIKDKFESGTVNAAEGGATSLGVDGNGYYLVTSSLGSKMIALTIGSANVSITEKNTYPTVDKKQGATAGTYADDDLTVKVGDTVYYQIEVAIPAATSKAIEVRDTMSSGLSYNNDAEVTGYEGTPVSDLKGATFGFSFAPNSGEAATATITFSATITADAILDTAKNNKVDLDYGQYHQEDTVYYHTYRAVVYKHDNTGKALEGVKFELRDASGNPVKVSKDTANNCYYLDANGTSAELVTDKDGFIVIRGITNTENTYKVYETETLPGYNLPADNARTNTLVPVEDDGNAFTPSADGQGVVSIENNSGAVLPSTGGIGTTIFYIIGGLLIVAAVVFFVVRRKNDAE